MFTKTLKPYLAVILTLAWSIACVQAQFTFSHVGTGATGSITPNAEPGSFTLEGGGDDIWSGSDNFDFAHETINGNFDIRVRVESLEFTATWTKAGIMARETLDHNSRMAFNRVTPSAGANDTRFSYRTGTSAPQMGEHEDGSGAPGYPNAWLRLVRAGNSFTAYACTDGLNWRQQGPVQDTLGWEGGAVSANLLVGLGVSRHSGADPLATCEFRDFGNAATTPAAISTQPASQTIEEAFSATLTFSAPGGFDIYDIQWRENGVDIPGATSPTYSTRALAVSDSGIAYSVAIRQKNNSTTATSADAVITVIPDTTKPTVVSVGTTAGIANRAVVVFSEPVNQGDAESLANYSLAGGATISAATLQADNKTVYLATSPLNTSGCKELTVSGIRDRAASANTIDSVTRSFIYADGSLRYNEYQGFGGGAVSDLTSNAKFPNNPDVTSFITQFENPNGGGGQGDNYGGRMVGYLTPAVSGDYTFYIAADDGAVLYLSTDDNPANKVAIATEPVWSGFRTYTGEAGGGGRAGCAAERPMCNISLPKSLVCGTRYYVEGLWKEGGGGDHMSVAWQGPGEGIPTGPIPGTYLSPLNPAAVVLAASLPADTTISENQNLVLNISITAGTPTWHIQWYKNGVAIPGATGTEYRIDNAKIPDSGTYHATVQNGLGVTTSRSAVVTVIVDTIAPAIISALAPAGNDTQFDLLFTEPVNEADAENLANYSMVGATLNSATLQADNKTVRFTTSTLYGSGCKTLTVNNIRDRAIPPNTLASANVGVVAAKGSIRYLQYNEIGGVVPVNLTSSPKFPNAADRILNVTQFENPAGSAGERDNYGAYFQGYVHPPISGEYRFYLSADDGAALFLSSDENPANKVQIAAEPIWSGFRQYQGSGAGGGGRVCPSASACNISQPITLQAGCKYYVDFIYKEGGGGDFGSVAWQLPGGPAPANGSAPIQAAFLSPYEVAASIPADQPADASQLEGRFVTFSADIQGSPNLSIQWYKNGAPITGGTGKSVIVGPLQYPEDDQSTYYVVAQNSLGTATSRTATLTVTEDTEAPSLIAAAGSTTFDRVTVTYNELVDPVTAGDEFSYTVSDGVNALSVIAADVLADGKTVLLTLDPGTPLQLNSQYTVSANGIADISGNVMDAGEASFRSAVEGCGGIVFEAYPAPGNGVAALTSHASFPNSPDFRMTIPGLDSRLAYPTDAREQYGARMRGVYVPPYSGKWVFYLRSDDASQLWFNPNGISAAGKQLVQQEPGCCQAFEALPTQPFDLVGGRPYYMEVLYKEGGGGDYAQVAARPLGSADPLTPIGARDVGQYAEPGFSGTLTVSGPSDQTVVENRIVTFSVNATSSEGLPICYQWSRDGSPITGANGSSYSFRATLADNGAVFTARASIVGNVVDSAAATLNVTVDASAPRVVGAKGSDTFRQAFVTFDEAIDPNTGGDEFNYAISGLNVTAADLLADGMTVRLETSEQTPGTIYTVTVSGVTDIAATPNPIDPAHSSANFTAFTLSCGLLAFEAWNDIAGTAVNDLVSNTKYAGAPDETRYMNTFDTVAALGSSDYRNNYGARVHGVFIPPTSGNWIFYLRSDDASQLYLNPAGIDPTGKILLTEEPGCCAGFAAHASSPQALTAGQHYFIEGIYKEGGGGDYIQVAAKLDTDARDPNSLTPLGAGVIGLYTDPGAAQITVNTQPASQTACIDPLSSALPSASFTVAASATPPAAPLAGSDFNADNGGYTVQTDTAFSGPWVYNAAAGVWQADGQAAELGAPMTSRLSSPAASISQAGVVRLSFSHRYSFEGGAWDGGQVRVSINGGPYTAVPGSAFTEGGYNGTVLGNSASVIAGQSGFLGDSPGHAAGSRITSTADIANVNPGDTVSVQFLYAADTNTRGGVPNWEIDSVTLTQGGQPGAPVFVQWQRNNGAGWSDIPGAFGNTYSFVPALTDSGAQFRVLLSSPGASCTTSAEATLTVIQANTAPKFDVPASHASSEDSAAQNVSGFANNISPHSITRTPVTFASAFNSVPAGMQLYGIASVGDGVLKLTTPINSANGAAAVNAGGIQTYESLEVSWKSYLGGGAGGGADGYSVNIGDNIPGDPSPAGPAEEGHPNATLSVSVDTFNNAELRNPDEGIQIEYQNAEIAFQNITKDNTGDGNYLRKSVFVDAKLTVDSAGVATLIYDGNTISGQIPNYAGIRANRVVFWARTGGANDNQWIDDLDIKAFPFDRSSVESGQNVSFEVSNNNPGLFSVQPAIGPDGTLSYAVAGNACGEALVSVVAKDDGGVACNGDDTSDAKTFLINVACVNDCPVATAQGPLDAGSGRPLGITLTGTDIDGDALTAAVASNPSHGTLAVVGGVLTYTSASGYVGPDSFTFTVNDGNCTSDPATVTLNVMQVTPPTCVASVSPANCGVTFPNDGKLYAVSLTGDPICLVLDSTGTTDPDGDALTITWVIDVTNTLTGPLVTTCLAPGCHTITMIASDGNTSCQKQIDVCVITAAEAAEQIITLVESTSVERNNKRPLIVSLKAAKAAFEQEGIEVGGQMLQVFKHKVAAQIARQNPGEAATFNAAADDVIRAVECAANLPPKSDE